MEQSPFGIGQELGADQSEASRSSLTPKPSISGIEEVRERLLQQIEAVGLADAVAQILRDVLAIPADIDVSDSAFLDARRKELQNDQQFRAELLTLLQFAVRLSKHIPDSTVHFCRRLGKAADMWAVKESIQWSLQPLLLHYIERIEDAPFDELAEQVNALHNIDGIQGRSKMADACFAGLERLVREHRIFKDPDFIEPTTRRIEPADLKQLRLNDSLKIVTTRRVREEWRPHLQTTEIMQSLNAIWRERDIRQNVSHVNEDQLRRDTGIYGAKGANLEALRKLVPELYRSLSSVQAHVPPFNRIPVDVHAQWKQGDDIRSQLKPFYDWKGREDIMVRSSAVFSEDNERTTGAGIYHSEPLAKDASFDEFVRAVERVYASVDSPKAREYRRANGIPDEQMGVVLQHRREVRGSEYSSKGYINSVRPHTPQLLEVVVEGRNLRVIFTKKEQEQAVYRAGRSSESPHALYYQVDHLRHHNMAFLPNVADIGMLAEMHYGKPVQIEFIQDHNHIHLLQARALPPHVLSKQYVAFPEDDTMLLDSDAIGCGDMELDVLPAGQNNQDKRGLVIFEKSYFTSCLFIEASLPKEGAVVVLCPSKENGGHIETLCVERGLLCLFRSSNDETMYKDTPASEGLFRQSSQYVHQLSTFTSIGGHRRVRVVADGLRGRVYPSSEQR